MIVTKIFFTYFDVLSAPQVEQQHSELKSKFVPIANI